MPRFLARFIHGDVSSVVFTASFISTAAISFFFIVGVSIVVPLLPVVVSEYGVSRAGAGMMLSSFAIGRLGFEIVGGVLGDRFGFRRIAIVACLLAIVCSLAAATAPPYGWLLAARVGQGIGSALYTTIAVRNVMDLAPEGHVGRLLAIYQGIILLGVSAGPILGGFVAEYGGLSATFLLYAGFGGAGLVLAWWLLPGHSAAPAQTPAPDAGPIESSGTLVRRLLADPTFLLILLAAFGVFWIRAGVGNTVLPLLASERFGFSESQIGLLLTALVAGNVIVMVHAGRAVDRTGRRAQLLRSLALISVVIAAYALVASPWVLVMAVVAFGMVKGYASVVPGVVVADLADRRIRGTAVGIQRTMSDLGLLLGPVSAGGLVDGFGFGPAFVAMGVLVAALAFSVSFMRETGPTRASMPLWERVRFVLAKRVSWRER